MKTHIAERPFHDAPGLRLLVPHDGVIYASDGDDWGIECEQEVDAARIVTCVNACAGIEDPAAAIRLAREALDAAETQLQRYATRLQAEAQRDEMGYAGMPELLRVIEALSVLNGNG